MRKLLLLLCGIIMLITQLQAQTRVITGKVTDETGAPIPQASVIIKGTSSGTTTKTDGTYSITVPSTAKILVISAVGLSGEEYPIGNNAIVNGELKSDNKRLQEVVVVGYGVQQKKSFTGAATKVDVKEFSSLLMSSVDKQLGGRAAGVQVTNVGGSVNTPARIRIRGIQSISSNNDPLIVVDGIPIVSGNLAGVGNSNTLGDINPSDIESLDILKDGSATAIYGSRAAGGVILITTKKGIKGRAKVTYETTLGFSSPLKKFDVLNAKDFELIANEKLTNAGQAKRAGVNAAADTSDTDWQGEVLNKNAFMQNHSLSVQGGNDKLVYYLSLNYSDQKGIIVSNRNKTFRLRSNIDYEINKFIKIGNNLSVSRQEDYGQNDGSNALGGSIASTLRLLPNVSPFANTISGYNITAAQGTNQIDKGPNGTTIDDNFSNTAFTLRNDKYYSDKYRIINNAYLEASIVKGLKFRSQVGVDVLNDYSYQSQNTFHGDGFGKGLNYNISQNWLRLVWSNYFNYNLSIKNHNIYVTAGNEVTKQTYKWFSAQGTPISDPFFIGSNVISNSNGVQSVSGNYDNTGFTSLFGRINYDFASKYFLQASIRKDGQSSLAPGKKYGTFPGFSVGWRPSQENFWANSGIAKTINEFKIKASYAKVGNALGGYPYLSTFDAALYGNLGGIIPSGVGNPALQWETSAKYDIGFELGFLNSRLTLTADWFLNDVDNLVLNVPQPLSAGLVGSLDLNGGTIPQNIGTLQNRGIELSLGGNVIRNKDFSWDFNVNYSQVKNKITSLYEVGGAPVANISNGAYNISRVGDPINIIFGYQSAGVNPQNGNPMWVKADGTLVQYNLTSSLGTVGSFYLADKNSGTLGAVSSLTNTDKYNLGQGVPTWYGGFSNSFNYKSFGLDFMFRYSGGNHIMNYTAQESLYNMSFQNNGKDIMNRWTTPGQITDVPKLYYGLAANMNATSNANSRFVEKGDYLRLQNIALSYNVNSKSLENSTKGYVRSLRLYIQAQNVYVWTKYKGADPDNISSAGVDAAVSPQVRAFSFGMNVGF